MFLFALVIGYGLAGDVPVWTVGFWALLAILAGCGVMFLVAGKGGRTAPGRSS